MSGIAVRSNEGLIATDAWRAVRVRAISRYKETGRATESFKTFRDTPQNLARCKMRFAFERRIIYGSDEA